MAHTLQLLQTCKDGCQADPSLVDALNITLINCHDVNIPCFVVLMSTLDLWSCYWA